MHQHYHVLYMVNTPLGSCRPVKLLPSITFWLLLGLVFLFLDPEWSLKACGLYTDETDIHTGTCRIFILQK